MLPRIAITTGDPAGIGPELCLRFYGGGEWQGRCLPVFFGDSDLLARIAEECGLTPPPRAVQPAEWADPGTRPDQPVVVDLQAIDAGQVRPGVVSKATGLASYRDIEAAIAATQAGRTHAMVTGPIHKEALNAAGVPFPGHTEILAHRTSSERYCMMLTSNEITCSFVTSHVGLAEVPGLICQHRVQEVIELSDQAIRKLRGRAGRLLVCGLNPHAGEHGLFGQGEEERHIAPAIASALAAGINVEGPLPADTAFLPARRASADCYVCMYHDQGLIPLKAFAFDTAVNVTLGLPIVRTSVDHGTALDIAWQGKASVSSLLSAIDLAIRLVA